MSFVLSFYHSVLLFYPHSDHYSKLLLQAKIMKNSNQKPQSMATDPLT